MPLEVLWILSRTYFSFAIIKQVKCFGDAIYGLEICNLVVHKYDLKKM